jgi:hypothetical protein
MSDKKVVWPFPSAGQIKDKPVSQDAVELKIKRNEENRRAEDARKSLGDALL